VPSRRRVTRSSKFHPAEVELLAEVVHLRFFEGVLLPGQEERQQPTFASFARGRFVLRLVHLRVHTLRWSRGFLFLSQM
jgi:hypothetical protein